MPNDWFTLERLALERYRLRRAEAEGRRELSTRLKEARVRLTLERALARALKALPQEEVRAALHRALRAAG